MSPAIVRIAIRNFQAARPFGVNKVIMGAGRAMSTPSQRADAGGECSYRCEFITGDSEFRKDSTLDFALSGGFRAEDKARARCERPRPMESGSVCFISRASTGVGAPPCAPAMPSGAAGAAAENGGAHERHMNEHHMKHTSTSRINVVSYRMPVL